jgi:rod shape determining protein RodA
VTRPREDFDLIFLAAFLALVAAGLVAVYSACQGEAPGSVSGLWKRQILFAGVGMVAFLVCASIPHAVWDRMSPVLQVLALGMLVVVLVAGDSGGGARRWFTLGGVRFQPSEPAKLATVLLLARVLASRRKPRESIFGMVVPCALVFLPAALVLREPDLGTALVFLAILPAMLYWSGISAPYILLSVSPALSVVCASSLPSWVVFSVFLLVLAFLARFHLAERILYVVLSLLAGIGTPLLWGRLEPYQQDRILAFVDPAQYSSGAGYQIIQSKVAIGSGGFAGLGFLEGTQKGLAFLPARHTDFVFSVVGEEFGFLGTVFVLGLFTLLVARGLRIAASVRDPFAGLTVVGILSMLSFQLLVNIGVTLGLVPVTGLPLPILSYGGTSLISTMASLGIVFGIGLRRRI